MQGLFSEAGDMRLNEIVQAGLLCAFDFDGTLAPIAAHPRTVHLPTDILEKLIELSRHAPIAIITGRSIEDVRTYLGFEPDFVIGNHGIEGMPGWNKNAESYKTLCNTWEQQLSRAMQGVAAIDPAVWIENKRYSLTVHYRFAQDRERTEEQLSKLFSYLEPAPRQVSGKGCFNLLPKDATDKGGALTQLMADRKFTHAIYVGDDMTDEAVFRLQRREILSVRVDYEEASAAEFFLRQSDIAQLLDELIGRLCAADCGATFNAARST